MEANDRLASARHYPLVTSRQERLLAPRDPFERQAAKMVQYPASGPATTRGKKSAG
jgi:hypothetical protein